MDRSESQVGVTCRYKRGKVDEPKSDIKNRRTESLSRIDHAGNGKEFLRMPHLLDVGIDVTDQCVVNDRDQIVRAPFV